MTRHLFVALAAALIGLPVQAAPPPHDPTDEAGRIPGTALSDSTQSSQSGSGPPGYRLYLEDALVISDSRNAPFLPVPFTSNPSWTNRTDLDIRGTFRLSDDLSVSYSDRLNALVRQKTAEQAGFAFDQDVRNDFREGYLTWQARPNLFLDVGRINQRNGVAYAFNPTDFLRTNTVIQTDSQDPRAMREDRLGVFMVRAQTVWSFGAVTLVYAPRLEGENPVPGDVPVNGLKPDVGLDPEFDRTNHSERFMLNVTLDLQPGIAPQFVFFHEHGQTAAGASLTYNLGQRIIAYAEWAGGNQTGIGQKSIDDCVAVKLCPPIVQALNLFPSREEFRNDAAAGLTYAFPGEITAILEYDYHQSGFDRADFDAWYSKALLIAGPDPTLSLRTPLLAAIWLPRQYSQARYQEPLSRQTLLGRLEWDDALVRNLTLAAFADVNLYDGSALAELSTQYDLSEDWRVGLVGDCYLGNPRSEFGTAPKTSNLLLSVAHFF